MNPLGQLEQRLLVGDRRLGDQNPQTRRSRRPRPGAARRRRRAAGSARARPPRLPRSGARPRGEHRRADPAGSRAARPPRAAPRPARGNQSIAAGPVSASIRRTLAALDPSEAILKIPISAVLATWVPPQSSRETSSTSTTRTHSPYFSPNSAIAPSCSASARSMLDPAHRAARLDPLVDPVLDVANLLGAERLAVGEVEAQLVRAHRRAGLAHVVAEPLAQRRVQEVGGGVVAHRRVAGLAVDERLDGDAGADLTGGDRHLQRLVVADPVDVEDLGLSPAPAQPPESATWPPPSA